MQTIQHNNPKAIIPVIFTAVFLIITCLIALFFASKQSASQPIPRTGLEDLGTLAPVTVLKDK